MIPAKVRKMCINKMRYPTRYEADKAASLWGQRVYPCPHCRQWHLTSR